MHNEKPANAKDIRADTVNEIRKGAIIGWFNGKKHFPIDRDDVTVYKVDISDLSKKEGRNWVALIRKFGAIKHAKHLDQ